MRSGKLDFKAMVSRNEHTQSSQRLLRELAGLYGVVPRYRDSQGRWQESPTASMLRVLAVLGAEFQVDPVAEWARVGEAGRLRLLKRAMRQRVEETWARPLEPCLVFWEGKRRAFRLHLPLHLPFGASASASLHLTLEGGENRHARVDLAGLPIAEEGRLGRRGYMAYVVPAGLLVERRGDRLPFGRHLLRVEVGRTVAEATVISAPSRCWMPQEADNPHWALFAPTYALRTERDWGAGDLSDLALLGAWVQNAGGSAVATLPLLATYLDHPFDPSPYRPVSRLFWNEFYLALDQTPEWERCQEAREAWGTRAFQAELEHLRALPLVDYGEVMRLKREVLERLSRCFFEKPGDDGRHAFMEYVRSHPEVAVYAGFRAETEMMGMDWRSWADGTARKERLLSASAVRDGGGLREAEEAWGALRGSAERERYHLYCQWRMDQQLRDHPGKLLLDVPVGVHPGGFDTWCWPDLFANDMSMGAPPDAFFAQGQDWGCFPIHPIRDRRQGHGYFAGYVARHMRSASYLRMDHVMSLHRLYWIPAGVDARDGVYVEYPAEELYALLCLESQRHQTVVIGEDLGTVASGVRAAMRRHEVLGTWVLQFAARPRGAQPVAPVPHNAVAALNTHDLFPFAGFLRGDDIRERFARGQVDEGGTRRELATRRKVVSRIGAWFGAKDGTEDLLMRLLEYLRASRPALVLVNVEDLLGQTRPQNRPGTGEDQGNWRLKIPGNTPDVRKALERAARWLEVRDRQPVDG